MRTNEIKCVVAGGVAALALSLGGMSSLFGGTVVSVQTYDGSYRLYDGGGDIDSGSISGLPVSAPADNQLVSDPSAFQGANPVLGTYASITDSVILDTDPAAPFVFATLKAGANPISGFTSLAETILQMTFTLDQDTTVELVAGVGRKDTSGSAALGWADLALDLGSGWTTIAVPVDVGFDPVWRGTLAAGTYGLRGRVHAEVDGTMPTQEVTLFVSAQAVAPLPTAVTGGAALVGALGFRRRRAQWLA